MTKRASGKPSNRCATVGMRICESRKKLKLSQEQLAEEMDVSRNSVANIEAGANFKVDTLISVCRALHVTPNDLLRDFFPELPASPGSPDAEMEQLRRKYARLREPERRKCMQFLKFVVAQYSGDEVSVDVKEKTDFFWRR